jgi:ribosomal-protein-alanine N-acetyltransferase
VLFQAAKITFDQQSLRRLVMELIPIKKHLHENDDFTNDTDCRESIFMTIEFYKKTGFNIPWISYYAKLDDKLVGAAAFKGKPVSGKVEIAYGVFPPYQQKGIGTRIAAELVQLSLKTDPDVIITDLTLPENNYTTRILQS